MHNFCTNSIKHKTLEDPSGISLFVMTVISKANDDQIDLIVRGATSGYILVKDLGTKTGG